MSAAKVKISAATKPQSTRLLGIAFILLGEALVFIGLGWTAPGFIGAFVAGVWFTVAGFAFWTAQAAESAIAEQGVTDQ